MIISEPTGRQRSHLFVRRHYSISRKILNSQNVPACNWRSTADLRTVQKVATQKKMLSYYEKYTFFFSKIGVSLKWVPLEVHLNI